jgi:Rrf2 family transcriptional regulator, iron-sulfur cluster assembly transcription factor
VKFSRTTGYALRVLASMAHAPREPRSSADLHRELKIPKKYLQRLLTALTKHLLVRSIRGRTGGYVLARSPRRVALSDIVEAVEGFDPQPQCFFGFSACSLDTPCAMHDRWARHQRSVIRTLTRTSLADLVAAPRR